MGYWSYLLAAVGVTGIFLVGRKDIWGWLVLSTNEFIWIAYALATDQYGFIIMALAYLAVYIKSYIGWKSEAKMKNPPDAKRLNYYNIDMSEEIDHFKD